MKVVLGDSSRKRAAAGAMILAAAGLFLEISLSVLGTERNWVFGIALLAAWFNAPQLICATAAIISCHPLVRYAALLTGSATFLWGVIVARDSVAFGTSTSAIDLGLWPIVASIGAILLLSLIALLGWIARLVGRRS